MERRIKYFDAIKLLAIFLVLYGHCVQSLLPGDPYDNKVYMAIYSFHMPLFMIISGIFFRKSYSLPFRSFIYKKALNLLLPCISWGLLLIVTRFLLNQENSFSAIFRHDFWFLKSLFICSTLAYIAYKITSLNWRIVYLLITIFITQISLFRLKDMYPCFLIGNMLYFKEELFSPHRKLIIIISFVIYVVLAYFFLNNQFFAVERDLYYPFRQLVVLFTGASASLFIIMIFQLAEKWFDSLDSALLNYGRYTLLIYLIQSFIIETFMHEFIICAKDIYIYLLFFPLVSVLIIFFSKYIANVLGKSRSCSLLFLGRVRYT